LRIYNCPAFTGENFTYSGSDLRIYNCPAFTGDGKWKYCLHENGIMDIGCKTMPIHDWVNFFENSTKTFETRRGTSQFEAIKKGFYVMKSFYEKYYENRKN
jgi:hypothetical protein